MCIFAAVYIIYSLNIYQIMAKGNLLLGYGRGKVGSLVFSRRKGEQITRARNTAPANPRTNAQLSQRMKMYAPVKLYRQSMERFFKYAFSLKSTETIFNGFMRENISIAPWTSRQLAVEQAPVPFPARMSSGGVGGFRQAPSYSDDEYTLNIGEYSVGKSAIAIGSTNYAGVSACIKGSDQNIVTIGDASRLLLDSGLGLQEGDLLTFVCVGTTALSVESGDVLYDGQGSFVFNYKRLKIDTASDVQLSTTGVGIQVNVDKALIGIEIPFNFEEIDFGGCVIVTRNVGSSIDASNTQLVLNPSALEKYNLMRTDAYRAKAAASYKAAPDAYLNPATASNE